MQIVDNSIAIVVNGFAASRDTYQFIAFGTEAFPGLSMHTRTCTF